jgi:hypothetical protein
MTQLITHISQMWLLGVSLAVLGNICSNFGSNVQKYSFNRESSLPIELRKKYSKQPLWIAGLSLTVFGSLFDFAALSMAASSLVSPISSISLVTNVCFSRYWLREKSQWKDLVGTLFIISGSALSVSFGNHSDKTHTADEMWELGGSVQFIFYLIIVILFGVIIYFYNYKSMPLKIKINQSISRYNEANDRDDVESMALQCETIKSLELEYEKYEKLHPLCLCALSGLFGGQSMLFGKIVSELFSQTIWGNNQITFLFFICLVSMGITVVCQLHFFALALSLFDAMYCVPIFQCFFISISTISGALFFDEFSQFSQLQSVMFPIGLLITFLGVKILSARKMNTYFQPYELGPSGLTSLSFLEDPNRGWYGLTYYGEKWKENTKKRTVMSATDIVSELSSTNCNSGGVCASIPFTEGLARIYEKRSEEIEIPKDNTSETFLISPLVERDLRIDVEYE